MKWEYKQLAECTEVGLNKMGEKGWELIRTHQMLIKGISFTIFTFKRQKYERTINKRNKKCVVD